MQTEPRPTKAQLAAFLWLKNRGGEGTFETNRSVLVARGERAPVTRQTWNALHGWGLVEILPGRTRLRISPYGSDYPIPAGTEESSSGLEEG